MEVLYCGIDFPHNKGEFCDRMARNAYFLGCFSTPFLYEAENRLLPGSAGDLLFMPPGTIVYHGPVSKEEAFVNDWIYIKGKDFKLLLDQYPIPQNTAFHIGDTFSIKKNLEKISEELLLRHIGYEDLISSYIKEIIIHTHRQYQREQQLHTASYRIERVREEFLKHPEEDWSLQKMAEFSGYSVSRFCALYSQRFGCSPKADLLDLRIHLAKQMLRYSELSVTEIAERCGFGSIYYFSKYFKEKESCTPRQWKTYGK